MEFLDIAKKRFSVRNYADKKVEQEKIDKILTAAHVAPTAANLQPVRLLVIQEEQSLQKLALGAKTFNAPLAIVVCADRSKAWTRSFDNKSSLEIDASIITDHMMLQATALGLGTVWLGYFMPEVLRKEFQLPDNLEPINILVIGYANGESASPTRHDKTRIAMDELVSYERF